MDVNHDVIHRNTGGETELFQISPVSTLTPPIPIRKINNLVNCP